ncbi:MAG: ATP-binding cassette domain-containing protein [Rhodospirillales bacterium]
MPSSSSARLNLRGEASVGEIVSFMGFATLLIGRLDQAMAFFARLFFQMHGISLFFGVLDTESTVKEKPGALSIGRVRGDVEFYHVNFSYGADVPAVRDLTFAVKAGTTVALVGSTGAGKSTAMALLHRLADPQTGTIRIDGIDIRDMTLDSLRRNIGVVFQESTMFYRTIADNLRVGSPQATNEELVEAAKLAKEARLHLASAEGLRYPRRRAWDHPFRRRAPAHRHCPRLLKDPPILILDEATSALDAATEARVQKALQRLMAGRTTFVIAHRLSTVRHADLILVFRQGHVVGVATLQSLWPSTAYSRISSRPSSASLPSMPRQPADGGRRDRGSAGVERRRGWEAKRARSPG